MVTINKHYWNFIAGEWISGNLGCRVFEFKSTCFRESDRCECAFVDLLMCHFFANRVGSFLHGFYWPFNSLDRIRLRNAISEDSVGSMTLWYHGYACTIVLHQKQVPLEFEGHWASLSSKVTRRAEALSRSQWAYRVAGFPIFWHI